MLSYGLRPARVRAVGATGTQLARAAASRIRPRSQGASRSRPPPLGEHMRAHPGVICWIVGDWAPKLYWSNRAGMRVRRSRAWRRRVRTSTRMSKPRWLSRPAASQWRHP